MTLEVTLFQERLFLFSSVVSQGPKFLVLADAANLPKLRMSHLTDVEERTPSREIILAMVLLPGQIHSAKQIQLTCPLCRGMNILERSLPFSAGTTAHKARTLPSLPDSVMQFAPCILRTSSEISQHRASILTLSELVHVQASVHSH